MLQQTQVATVIPYYHRFLARFPTLIHLAEADEQAVLRLWEGLGYYRRARDLCRAARVLKDNSYTLLPDNPEVLGALPGFGRYTTNAVLSQAFDRRLPIVEANSERVLCRLFGIARSPKDGSVRKRLWELAESLLPRLSVGAFNQAMMELGALVCTPSSPNCGKCPLKALCKANQQGRQAEIPLRAKAPKVVAVSEVAVVVHKMDRVLLMQRPAVGRWANLWEFPHVECRPSEAAPDAAHRLLAGLGIRADIRGELATISHSVTRFRITMTCLRASHRQGSRPPNGLWVRPDDLENYPLCTPQRRLAELLATPESRQLKSGGKA